MAGNKNVISGYLKNVDQGHRLQKSLCLSYHMTDFNQIFTRIMQMGLTTKVSHKLTMKI